MTDCRKQFLLNEKLLFSVHSNNLRIFQTRNKSSVWKFVNSFALPWLLNTITTLICFTLKKEKKIRKLLKFPSKDLYDFLYIIFRIIYKNSCTINLVQFWFLNMNIMHIMCTNKSNQINIAIFFNGFAIVNHSFMSKSCCKLFQIIKYLYISI